MEEDKKSDDEECVCSAEDCEGDCKFEDEESERSYDGSDADEYYYLKELREKRKREKLGYREEKERDLGFEKAKEEEVRVVNETL